MKKKAPAKKKSVVEGMKKAIMPRPRQAKLDALIDGKKKKR